MFERSVNHQQDVASNFYHHLFAFSLSVRLPSATLSPSPSFSRLPFDDVCSARRYLLWCVVSWPNFYGGSPYKSPCLFYDPRIKRRDESSSHERSNECFVFFLLPFSPPTFSLSLSFFLSRALLLALLHPDCRRRPSSRANSSKFFRSLFVNRSGYVREFTVRPRGPVVKNRASLVTREHSRLFSACRLSVTARLPTGNARERHRRPVSATSDNRPAL